MACDVCGRRSDQEANIQQIFQAGKGLGLDLDPVGAFFSGTSTKLFKTDLALAVTAKSVWMTREEVTKMRAIQRPESKSTSCTLSLDTFNIIHATVQYHTQHTRPNNIHLQSI